MKRFCLVLVLSLCFVPVESQVNLDLMNRAQRQDYYNKLQKKGITGIIKYEYAGEAGLASNRPLRYTVMWLNETGQPLKVGHYDAYRKLSRYEVFYYDNQGLLNEKTYCRSDGSLSWKEAFFYDVTGELVEIVEFSDEGAFDGRRLNEFDEDGALCKTREMDHDDNLSFFRIAQFNDKGLPTYISSRHAKGFTMSSKTINYDENGLPQETIIAVGFKGESVRKTYEYNRHALLTGIKEFHGGKIESVTVVKYFDRMFQTSLNEDGFQNIEINKFNENSHGHPVYAKSARFPGGDMSLKKYIAEHITYPDDQKKQGVIEVQFEVKANGKVRKVKVNRGLSDALDALAEDVIKEMPKWLPAEKKDGTAVKSVVIVSVPILK